MTHRKLGWTGPDDSKLIVGGQFQYLNTNVLAQGMGALDLTTGAALTWNDGIASFGPLIPFSPSAQCIVAYDKNFFEKSLEDNF